MKTDTEILQSLEMASGRTALDQLAIAQAVLFFRTLVSRKVEPVALSLPKPFGWVKQSEIDSSDLHGGSINLWRKKYDCDVPLFAQPTTSAQPLNGPDFRKFMHWAGSQGYDCAQTYDTNRSKWVALNPMTADLWKAWQAANGITASQETTK